MRQGRVGPIWHDRWSNIPYGRYSSRVFPLLTPLLFRLWCLIQHSTHTTMGLKPIHQQILSTIHHCTAWPLTTEMSTFYVVGTSDLKISDWYWFNHQLAPWSWLLGPRAYRMTNPVNLLSRLVWIKWWCMPCNWWSTLAKPWLGMRSSQCVPDHMLIPNDL